MEHAAPPKGRGLRPCPVRRTATKPVEGLVAKDPADEYRVFGFGADPRQECLRRSHDLMQEALVPPSLLQDRAQVDRVDDLEVELVLGVHLEERFEGRRFGARGPQGLRGPLGADRRLADFLGHGGKEGHEHRWWHERLLDQPVIYSAAPGSINPSLAIIARDRHLCQAPSRPEYDYQKAMSDTLTTARCGPSRRGAHGGPSELRTTGMLRAWRGRADEICESGRPLKAYVTLHPCPRCASPLVRKWSPLRWHLRRSSTRDQRALRCYRTSRSRKRGGKSFPTYRLLRSRVRSRPKQTIGPEATETSVRT